MPVPSSSFPTPPPRPGQPPLPSSLRGTPPHTAGGASWAGGGAVAGAPHPCASGAVPCAAGALATSPSPTQVGKGRSSCPQNWLHHRGFCYGYFTERRTWAEAEDDCGRYGPRGHLASIHSTGESRVLARYISGQRDTDNTWIGLWDDEHTRRWKWSDNSAFNFKQWAWGQPNNLWDREDCTVLDKLSGFERWHDYPCDYKFPYLCQYQA